MGVLLEIMMAWAERVDGGIWMGWGSGKQKNIGQGRKKGSTDAGARERGTRGHRPEAIGLPTRVENRIVASVKLAAKQAHTELATSNNVYSTAPVSQAHHEGVDKQTQSSSRFYFVSAMILGPTTTLRFSVVHFCFKLHVNHNSRQFAGSATRPEQPEQGTRPLILSYLEVVEVAQRRAQHLGRGRFHCSVQKFCRRAKLKKQNLTKTARAKVKDTGDKCGGRRSSFSRGSS